MWLYSVTMKFDRHYVFALLLCITFATDTSAQLCTEWSEPAKIGQISAAEIDEASGLVPSAVYPGRLYWINDSGDKARIYVTDSTGRLLQKFSFSSKKMKDTEALAYGDCGRDKCLIAADIGDNDAQRKSLTLVFIKEVENFSKSVEPAMRLEIKFPDGPRDTEALALLPSGDLIFVTKKAADVYVLPKADLALTAKPTVKTLKKLGTFPMATWFKEADPRGRVVTDMGIDPKRAVVGLLTYQNAIEIPLARMTDLSGVSSWKAGVDFSPVTLRPLLQQETLTYSDGQLLWSSEVPVGTEAPIQALTCRSGR